MGQWSTLPREIILILSTPAEGRGVMSKPVRAVGAISCAAALLWGLGAASPATAKSGVMLDIIGRAPHSGRYLLVATGGDDDPADHDTLCIQRVTATSHAPHWVSLRCVPVPPQRQAAVLLLVRRPRHGTATYRAVLRNTSTGRIVSTSPRIQA